jgi:5,10-methylenetetrahydromethanopterin reductase
MLLFDHLGVAFSGRTPTQEIVSLAQVADEAGLGSLWVTESLYFRGGLTTMMAAAAATKRIHIGPGVASIFSRHPAVMAMEAATIDEYSQGRFFLGLGATPYEPIADFKSLRPIRAFREFMDIFNGLIAQTIVDYEGEVFRMVKAEHWSPTGTSLNFQPFRPRIPIYIGTTGPQTLRLAGRVADGVVLTNLSNPPYIRWVADHVRAGAEQAGRDPADCKICAFITLGISEDREAARRSIKDILAIYYHNVGEVAVSTVGTPDESLQLLGVTVDHYYALDRALKSGGVAAAAALIGDEEIERSAVAGTPEECVEQLLPFLEAGLQVPIAFHALGPDKAEALRLLGARVIPALRERVMLSNAARV